MKFTGERMIPEEMTKGNNPEHAKHLNRIYKEHIARYEWAKQFCEGKSVLDAACGSGYGTAILREVANGTLGFDISEEAIQYAEMMYINGVNGENYYLQHDLEKGIKIAEDFFEDVIVSFETIEHLENPHNFLKDCSELCETFIFSIPLNNKSEFHKQVYNLEEAQNLINQYFGSWKIDWYEQNLEEIKPLTKEGRFLIGVARRKDLK